MNDITSQKIYGEIRMDAWYDARKDQTQHFHASCKSLGFIRTRRKRAISSRQQSDDSSLRTRRALNVVC